MAQVVLSELADADAADILSSFAVEAGRDVAARYSRNFDRLFRRLEHFPEIGTRRSALGTLARICVVLPYVIVYEYSRETDSVVVLRILHGRRDIGRPLLER